MVKSVLVFLSVLTLPAFGQNSITVTATRNANAQADQVLFGVDVISDTDASRDDVLAVLQGSSIGAANFSSVRTSFQSTALGRQIAALDWSFSLAAPLANFKTTISQLTALQQVVAQKKNGMSLSFSIQGTQASAQAQQAQTCPVPDLLADARAQAQKLAVAAGAGVGSVLAMSGATASQPASGALFTSPTYFPSCSLTVKFALTGF